MNRQCAGIRADGERCRGIPATGSDYCPAHDPARSEARREAAARAGASRRGPALALQAARLGRRLEAIADEVLSPPGDSDEYRDPKRYAVAVQAINGALRALSVSADLHERQELEARLKRLEEGARWAG